MMRQVLLVDEPGDDQAQLAQIIRSEGHKVSGVASGEMALVKVAREPVDLVITELMMPDINGWDVLEGVKNYNPEIHVVVMTSRITDAAEKILTSRHADGYLVKPCDPERTVVLLNALLDPDNLDRDAEVAVLSAYAEDREVMETALQERGILVYGFDDGKPFLRHVNRDEPDLIVVDLNPSLGIPIGVCREIRFTYNTAHIPILLLVEKPSRSLIEQAVRVQVNGVLTRPFQPEVLGDRVINMLKQADFKKTKNKKKY